jgi:periplasmic protein TonB
LNFKATITGIAASAILLAVLGIARLFTVTQPAPDLTVREVETAIFEPPPPPPPPEEIPEDAPPPPPALMEVSAIPDATRIPIPQAMVPMDFTAPVENFHTDLTPAPLPAQPKTPQPSRVDRSQQFFKNEKNYVPAVKSQYSTGELDAMPRLLRHGSATFPSELARKGVTRGTVVLQINISTSGAVSVIGVSSATHQELVPSARRVAAGSRFTPPTHKGTPVKAIMNWPIVIEK